MDDQERQEQIRKLNVRLSDDKPELQERIDEIISEEREKISQIDREEGEQGPAFDYPDEDRRRSRIKGLNVTLTDEVRSPAERLDQTISDERQRVYEAGKKPKEVPNEGFPEEIRRSGIKKAGVKLKEDPERLPNDAIDSLISSGRNEAYEASRQKKSPVPSEAEEK